jgi:hypothetical protein
VLSRFEDVPDDILNELSNLVLMDGRIVGRNVHNVVKYLRRL